MKKLMMAVAVALAAIGLNAATVNWQATKGYLYDGAETPAKLTSGDAYLMYVTASYTQADLVADFVTANYDTAATLSAMTASGALASGKGEVNSSGRIGIGTTSTGAPAEDATAYFVVFNDDKMYVSITGNSVYDSVTAEASLSFNNISASSKLSFDATAGYSAAGWYGAVPEPTSGLLMLLGMAGLALRRKRV